MRWPAGAKVLALARAQRDVDIRGYTRVGAYLGEHRAPCVGVYVTRYAAASAAAYLGQDRRLHVWREYRYTRLHAWPRILARRHRMTRSPSCLSLIHI